MIVYAVNYRFVGETSIDDAAVGIAEWLRKKVRREVNPRALLEPGSRYIAPDHQVEVESIVGEPSLSSIRYTHPDAVVKGRRWVTEIGFRKDGPTKELDCSILLRTEEISARVSEPVRPSRPGVVLEILKLCRPSPEVPGLKVSHLDGESAEAFLPAVEDPRRSHCIVIISAGENGEYPVNLERLRGLVLGLAEVVLIPPGADTHRIERIVGRTYCAWGGAVRLIYPPTHAPVPTRLILQSSIREHRDQGEDPELEILSLLLHRVNHANSLRHISREEVRRARTIRELGRSREAAQDPDNIDNKNKYISELEETFMEHESEKSRLQGEIRSLVDEVERQEDRIGALEDEVRRLRYDSQGLKDALANSQRSRPGPDEPRPAELAEAIADAIVRDPTPEDCLVILLNLYPARLRVLDSAWRSAGESESFRYGRKLFDLLDLLVNDYYEALGGGAPDATARQVFGSHYAARESDTVEKTVEARRRRTFDCDGRPIEMFKHLKIGVKDSAAETIRVHFEWMASEGRIVIGYCGPHIPFR